METPNTRVKIFAAISKSFHSCEACYHRACYYHDSILPGACTNVPAGSSDGLEVYAAIRMRVARNTINAASNASRHCASLSPVFCSTRHRSRTGGNPGRGTSAPSLLVDPLGQRTNGQNEALAFTPSGADAGFVDFLQKNIRRRRNAYLSSFRMTRSITVVPPSCRP